MWSKQSAPLKLLKADEQPCPGLPGGMDGKINPPHLPFLEEEMLSCPLEALLISA